MLPLHVLCLCVLLVLYHLDPCTSVACSPYACWCILCRVACLLLQLHVECLHLLFRVVCFSVGPFRVANSSFLLHFCVLNSVAVNSFCGGFVSLCSALIFRMLQKVTVRVLYVRSFPSYQLVIGLHCHCWLRPLWLGGWSVLGPMLHNWSKQYLIYIKSISAYCTWWYFNNSE